MILVTGGTGFIGSHLVPRLLERGEHIRLLTTSTRSPSLAAGHDLDLDLEIITADIRDVDAMRRATAGVDVVYHLAGRGTPGSPESDYPEIFDVNINGTKTLFEAAIHSGVRKVVLTSSASVYGDTAISPTIETTPTHPQSAYATSKVAAEDIAQSFYDTGEIDVSILRIFNVYGPGQAETMVVPRFIGRLQRGEEITLYGNGEQIRDFIHVSDVIQAAILATDVTDAEHHVFNIASGQPTTIRQIVDIFAGLLGVEPLVTCLPERPGEIHKSIADIKFAREFLGYSPSIDIEQGLGMTCPIAVISSKDS